MSTPFGALFRGLGSQRLTQVLAVFGSGIALATVLIPQGEEAVAIAAAPNAAVVRQLAGWGVTALFASPWFLAFVALVAGNVVAVALRAFLEPPPATAGLSPVEASFELKRPEFGAELVREVMIGRLGAPIVEAVVGPRVTLEFSPGRTPELGRVLTHLGLIVLVLGAGAFGAESQKAERSLAHAILRVTDVATGATGRFDVVAGEPIHFFQQKAQHVLRDYTPMRLGLGPAVRFEVQDPASGGSQFWVYLHAPAGFDRKHRQSGTTLEAESMGLSPRPGLGLSGSVFGVVMASGLMLLALGAIWGQRTRGRLEVRVEGRGVRLRGFPEQPGDRAFARAFERWKAELGRAIEETV